MCSCITWAPGERNYRERDHYPSSSSLPTTTTTVTLTSSWSLFSIAKRDHMTPVLAPLHWLSIQSLQDPQRPSSTLPGGANSTFPYQQMALLYAEFWFPRGSQTRDQAWANCGPWAVRSPLRLLLWSFELDPRHPCARLHLLLLPTPATITATTEAGHPARVPKT